MTAAHRIARDRSVDCDSRGLGFSVHSEAEVTQDEVDRLQGVGGVRMRVAEKATIGGAPKPAFGFRAGTMVRDPDGHAVRVLAH